MVVVSNEAPPRRNISQKFEASLPDHEFERSKPPGYFAPGDTNVLLGLIEAIDGCVDVAR
jgi:hypothetical protein